MSFYGKMLGSLAAAAIIGGSAAYVAGESAEVLSHTREVLYDSAEFFVLGEYDGRIALFEEGNPEPIAVYSTPTTQINPADEALLREGIRVRGMNEVCRLLEDLEIE